MTYADEVAIRVLQNDGHQLVQRMLSVLPPSTARDDLVKQVRSITEAAIKMREDGA
jgi:hypothetical protein